MFIAGLTSIAGCVDHSPAGLQDLADEASAERFGGGFAVVVIDDQGRRTEGVAGTLADGTPMDSTLPWVIGSVSKAFVATTVMQLIDEGSLSLDDAAVRYLDHPFVPQEATVFDLLHHSSGIPDYVQDEQWIATMRSCPARAPHPFDHVSAEPVFAPGTQWGYSNTSYLLLGEIIETVTGNPVQSEIRRRILEPLELRGTYLLGVEAGERPMDASQDFFDSGPGPLSDCQMAPAPGPAPVDGMMVSTVSDLDRFYRALFGGNLLSQESLDAMMTQSYVGADSGHGLGIIHLLEPPVEGVDIYANGGGIVGYKTLLMFDLESETTIVAVSPNGFGFEHQQSDILHWAFGS